MAQLQKPSFIDALQSRVQRFIALNRFSHRFFVIGFASIVILFGVISFNAGANMSNRMMSELKLEEAHSANQLSNKEDGDESSVESASDKNEVLEVAETLLVDVSGAVKNPNVYELAHDARIADAIIAAGGLVADANIDEINRAAPVSDGMKVYIPHYGEVPALASTFSDGTASTSENDIALPARININTASASELDELPGIGPSTAEAIITDRETQGPFTTPEDLMRVSGIGEKKFEKIQDAICV